MAGQRFCDFSFVDRITQCEDGHVTGTYTVPANVRRFPPSLMAEAVGQLAAWAAMRQLDFAVRPVAGLADDTVYARGVLPGETLALEAHIDRCDADAVAYGGSARIGGTVVAELINCVGPMLPMEEFDDPAAMRADYALLTAGGAPPGRFRGVPEPQLATTAHEPGARIEAQLAVPPADAAFFADHFPRRPVFPGTLLMDAVSRLAVQLAAEAIGVASGTLMTRRVGNVKIRAFTPPAATLALECTLTERDATGARIKVAVRSADRTIAVARMQVVPQGAEAT